MGWPPGVPASLLLLGTTFIGAVLGKYWIAARHYKRPLDAPRGRLLRLAILVFTVSLPFWIWAVQKVAKGDSDYGIATFAGVLITACAAYREAFRPMRGVDDTHLRAACIAMISSQLSLTTACALVAANYLYVVIRFKLLDTSFQVYLIIGVVWWSLATVAAYKLESRVRQRQQAGVSRGPAALRRERQLLHQQSLLAEPSEDDGEDGGEAR